MEVSLYVCKRCNKLQYISAKVIEVKLGLSTIEIERLKQACFSTVTDDNQSCRDLLAKVVTKNMLEFIRERITIPYCRFSFIVKYRRGVF